MDEEGPESPFLAVDPDIETALNAGAVGLWRWRVGGTELGWTRNLEAIHLLPPGTFDGTFESFSADIEPVDFQRVMETIRYSIATGHPYEVRYRNRPLAGIEPIWIEARGEIVSSPDGERYLTGVCQNATLRIRDQKELERRLQQQQAVSELGTFALAHHRFDDVVARAVTVIAEVLSVPLVSLLELNGAADAATLVAGQGWAEGLIGTLVAPVHPKSLVGLALEQQKPIIIQDAAEDRRFVQARIQKEHNVVSGLVVMVKGDDERPFGVFGAFTTTMRRFDDADAKFLLSIANIIATSSRHAHMSERREIVIREMAHRSGNLLQQVQSLFNQTLAPSLGDESVETFRARLATLANANLLLAHDGWTLTRMQRIVEAALGAFADRADTSGRDLLLPADLGLDLSLILHELTTNSAKYGGLATTDGQVSITWDTATEESATVLTLHWIDPEGTWSEATGRGTGFGSRLIRMLVERKWGGNHATDQSDGYRFSLSLVIPDQGPTPTDAV